ncbi:hypothetical protein [Mesonia aquimarina]|uniref:hypothetical protein n=1 Tax=Mesonia aquimarina TaxID=1504967 RepID=UPI000EF61B13|nr:hypothetical protein [Mesonia aquimarina]
MHQKKIFSIILLLLLGYSVFGQGDPCEHLLDPDRNGSIVLPDGKSWCDVAQETGSAYAKCKCKHSSAMETSKGKMQAEIDNMYAQRDALIDKANKAKRNAYQISLTDDDSNFDTKKQAKIAFLEEYIGYNEQVIGLLKEMNQRFGMNNNVNATEQDVAHKRAEINRLHEKEQSKTHTLSIVSDKTAHTSSGQSDGYTENNQSQESIYQKRQREAQQAERERETQRKAREAEVQRRVAASQRQYEQTMANKQQASNYISDVFESQYQNIRNKQERKWQEIERQQERDRREREASRLKEEERKRQAAEEKRIENAKSNFLSSIADVKIPLFFEHPQAYVLFVSKMGNETIKIIPVTLYKNTDNQLPYKIEVIKKIKTQKSLNNLSTHGVYSSYEQLQTQVDQLYSSAQNNYIKVTIEKQIDFGKKQTETGNSEDFWGSQKTNTKAKSKKDDDFWD